MTKPFLLFSYALCTLTFALAFPQAPAYTFNTVWFSNKSSFFSVKPAFRVLEILEEIIQEDSLLFIFVLTLHDRQAQIEPLLLLQFLFFPNTVSLTYTGLGKLVLVE